MTSYPVTVHPFTSLTPHSCAYERGKASSPNALVYIGGLTSGPHTTPALDTVFEFLNDDRLGYSLWEFRMRSSYTGFGHSSLSNDVEDIAALVKYLRELGKKRIVLLGSSTGCQGCMEYMDVAMYNASEVDGYVLQAPTSDRETAGMLMPPAFYRQTLKFAQDEISRGNEDVIMPRALIPPIFDSPITAYRWHSLIAPGGDDDYFSSDLDDTTLALTFGRINKPILIMPSQNDELVPLLVNKQALLERWIRASPIGIVNQLSNLIPGADHTLSTMGAQQWFAEIVVLFLRDLEQQAMEDALADVLGVD